MQNIVSITYIAHYFVHNIFEMPSFIQFFFSLLCVTFIKSYKSQWMLTPIQILKTTKTRTISIQITSCSVLLIILAFLLKIPKRINLDENTACESQLDLANHLLPFHLFSSDVIFCYDAEPTFNSLLSKPVLQVIFFLNPFVHIVDENKSCFKRKKKMKMIIIEINFINHLLDCDELLSSFNLMLCQLILVVVWKKLHMNPNQNVAYQRKFIYFSYRQCVCVRRISYWTTQKPFFIDSSHFHWIQLRNILPTEANCNMYNNHCCIEYCAYGLTVLLSINV